MCGNGGGCDLGLWSSAKLVLCGVLVALFVVALAPWSAAGRPTGPDAPRVASEGGILLEGSDPWAPHGINDYRATSIPGGYVCDEATGAISNTDLGDRLDGVAAAGGNVVRTWFFQSFWDPDRDGEGNWQAFDRMVDAAAARGLRVIPVLGNHWEDCTGGAPAKAALAGFTDAMAAEIRSADPHHLISLGTIGLNQCGTAAANYERVHAAADVCEVHLYDPTAADLAWAGRDVASCAAEGKSTVVGELGISLAAEGLDEYPAGFSSPSAHRRTHRIRNGLNELRGLGAAGFLLWNLEGDTPGAGEDPFGIGPCDPAIEALAGFDAELSPLQECDA